MAYYYPDFTCKFSVVGAEEVNAALINSANAAHFATQAREFGCHYCGNPEPGAKCRYCGVTSRERESSTAILCARCGAVPDFEWSRDEFAGATIVVARCHGQRAAERIEDVDLSIVPRAHVAARHITAMRSAAGRLPPSNPARGVKWRYPIVDEVEGHQPFPLQGSFDGITWHGLKGQEATCVVDEIELAPEIEGMLATVRSSGNTYLFTEDAWELVSFGRRC